MTPRIGVDLDNTLASLDHLFQERASRRGWLPPHPPLDKTGVRQLVRARADGEGCWQELQAEVYGPAMAQAQLMAGAAAFMLRCRQEGQGVYIVSHKTPFAANGTDLQGPALAWLASQGAFHPQGWAIPAANLFFEASRLEKLARIATLGLDYFVDDLPEVLTDAAFPADVRRLWFNPGGAALLPGLTSCTSWWEIQHLVFPR